jgi:hypothetical protein
MPPVPAAKLRYTQASNQHAIRDLAIRPGVRHMGVS